MNTTRKKTFCCREVQPYLHSSDIPPEGVSYKHGFLDLRFELDADGKSILRHLERRAPLIVQQALYFDEAMPQMPCVYILSSGGPNVDGDRYEQSIMVHRDAYAHIATGAATKLAEMKQDFSGLIQHFVVDVGGYLEYLPEPIIPCQHTRFVSETTLVADATATLFYSEIFTAGRKHYRGQLGLSKGEQFDYDLLSISTIGERPNGAPLFREKWVIAPHESPPQRIGMLADYDVLANVIILTPQAISETIYQQTCAQIDKSRHLAIGVSRLPYEAGLQIRVMGIDTSAVKQEVRTVCSHLRTAVKGVPLPPEFPWR